jgi:hypothetical protein
MKKIACAVFLAMAILCVSPWIADAQGPRGHGGGYPHGHGGGYAPGGGGHPAHWNFGFYWGGPGWYWPWWGPYYGYGYYPPAPTYVVPQQPQVYVQPQQPQEQAYWYYCQDPHGYYPYVQNCPGGWMKVVPTPTPPTSPTP